MSVALQNRFGPFAARFESRRTLYLDPAFSQILAWDHEQEREVLVQLLSLYSLETKAQIPLQWEALKSCRDSLWMRPQEWMEKNHFGILINWVPPGRYFSESAGILKDEQYLKWLQEALSDLHQIHRRGILHLAQNEKTWILFQPNEEAADESMGLSDVGLLTEVPIGQALSNMSAVAIAPELLRGEAVDERADLYALACLILRQRSARFFERYQNLSDLLSLHWNGRIVELVPERETPLNELLRQMLQFNPKDRPQSAEILLKELGPKAKADISRPRKFPEWSQQRITGRQNTLILNALFTLVQNGETKLPAEMLEHLASYLEKKHEPYLRYLQGRLAREAGDEELARERHRQATVRIYTQPDPKLKALLFLEEYEDFLQRGKSEKALAALNQAWEAIEHYPEVNLKVQVLCQQGRLHKELGDEVAALRSLKQAEDILPDFELSPEKVELVSELSELLVAYGFPQQAKPLISQALLWSEQNRRVLARRYLQAGLGSAARKDWKLSEEQFSEARFLYGSLKDIKHLIWAGAHGARLFFAKKDFQQVRRELKALRIRNRGLNHHELLLDLLELQLWLVTDECLRTSPNELLKRIEDQASVWDQNEVFNELGWPACFTCQILEKVFQKLGKYSLAKQYGEWALDFRGTVVEKLNQYGYCQEEEIPNLTILTAFKNDKLEPPDKIIEVMPKPEVKPDHAKDGGEFESDHKRLREHAHYLEQQIQHLSITKEHLAKENGRLNNEIQHLRAQLDRVSVPAMPSLPTRSVKQRVETEGDEEAQILSALQKHQGSRSLAAQELSIHRRTLLEKMKKYGLDQMDFLPGREEILKILQECKDNKSTAAKQLGMSRSSFYRRLKELGIA